MFTGTVSVKLSTPIKWEGREIEVVDLDFGKVNGGIITQCERETFQGGNFSGLVRSRSEEYCSRMAALISGLPYRVFEKMNSYDYEFICLVVGSFIDKRNPQKFYDKAVLLRDMTDEEEDEEDIKQVFTKPAEKKPEKQDET